MATEQEIGTAISRLIGLGVVARWRCDICDDWVLYRTRLAREVLDVKPGSRKGIAYTEEASRKAHNKAHLSGPAETQEKPR